MSRKHRTASSRQRPPVRTIAPVAPVAVDTTEEKANPAFAGVTIINDVPQPHTMPKNYRNYADQGFSANDSVYKCVTYIISNGAAIPPLLYSDATRQTEIKSHPILDRLARPNPEQDGVTFREAVLGWYLIAGNAFIYAIRAGKKTGVPNELWVLEANKVHPLPTPQGITGYMFDDFESSQNPIPPQNIAHLRTWNPKDPIFGLSPIEVAALMIDQQTAARKWDLAIFQNAGKPSGAWVTDATLTKNDRDRLEERINEKLAGARNAGRVPVIDAGAKWVPSSLAPSELDWLESLKYNAGQIANIYNIPPQLIGDTSATTYNNMQEAKAASYTEAIFPALDKLYSLLSLRLVAMYPDLCDDKGQPVAVLSYDKTTVEVVQTVIQERETARAQRAGQLYLQGVITLNQAQVMQGLPSLGVRGEVYRIGAVLVPADKLDEYAEQSLTTPAAPPLPQPEPIQPPAAPSGTSPDDDTPGDDTPDDDTTDDTPAKKPPTDAGTKARTSRQGRKSSAIVTHLVWECDGNPCAFCLQNDGAIVEADEDGDPVESFPNGCDSPDDSHKWCECVVHELAVPVDAADDLPDAVPVHASADGTRDDRALTALVTLYGVGLIASRHARDAAAQQQQQQGQIPAWQRDDDEDDEGEETDEDQTGATYAASAPSTSKPTKPKPVSTHKQRRQDAAVFRAFREVTLG